MLRCRNERCGVDVTFFALTHGRVAVILARSTTGGTRFVSRLDVTDSPFDPSLGLPGGGKHGRWWIGDYQGLAAGGGMIHRLGTIIPASHRCRHP